MKKREEQDGDSAVGSGMMVQGKESNFATLDVPTVSAAEKRKNLQSAP